jgi:hypothetical protein
MEGRPTRRELLGAVRALILDTTATETLEVLAAAGVRSLLLRGPALAVLLYEDPSRRPYSDVDLLVNPDQLAEAEVALARHGFVESPLETALPEERPKHAHTWRAPSGGTVDLHRTLIGIDALPAATWHVLSRRTEMIPLGGIQAEVPSVASRALIVALHAAHHVDEPSQALNDLELALERLPPPVWVDARGLADELGAIDAFVAGLSLHRRGREQLVRIGLSPTADAARYGARGTRSFHVAQAIVWLAETPGVRAKARFLRHRLVPSARTMRRRSRLARRGPVGLVLAYLLRWVDAARHLPSALSALRRSRH